MKATPTGRAWLAACAGALAVAACGGSDDDDGMRYAATILVSDTAAAANPYGGSSAHVDPNLVNAWGIAFNPHGFVWVRTQARRPRRCTTATACPSRWS